MLECLGDKGKKLLGNNEQMRDILKQWSMYVDLLGPGMVRQK